MSVPIECGKFPIAVTLPETVECTGAETKPPLSPIFSLNIPELCSRCHREGEKAAVREYRLAPDGSVLEYPWATTEHKANGRRTGQVEVSGPGTPEHLRFYGVRKVVHGVPVVEVHKDWYFSPDLRVSANRQYKSEGAAENGWIVVDELHPHLGHSEHISTKPEALRLMAEWAKRLSQETR